MANARDELTHFVNEALKLGESRERIREALLGAGWPPAQVENVLGSYADTDFPVPVPRPRAHLSARDAFVYLSLFAVLYVVAFQFGNLVFQLINLWLPDPVESPAASQWYTHRIRWSVASLIVALPVFLYLSRLTGRELKENPAKRLSGVRRWLTYITLFVAVAILIGSGINLIYTYLSGELTFRFGLKVAVVVFIAGSIFGFYLAGLRQEERSG